MKSLQFVILSILLAYVLCIPITGKTTVDYTIPSEWNLIPDESGRLKMMHASEIISETEMEPFFYPEFDCRFILHTRKNRDNPQFFTLSQSLLGSYFDPTHETRLTIHGWNGDNSSGVNYGVARALLNTGDFNVITVDWSRGAGTINYIAARNRVQGVGRIAAQFLDRLVKEKYISLEAVTVIGHSLGGHIAGVIGKHVKNGILNSIIALDPAGPLFSLNREQERVAPNDADYVEVIHTNGGLLGFLDPIGQADFFPNGGSSQPGCGVDLVGNCAHGRSTRFYIESITTRNGFWSVPCASFSEIRRGRCTPSGPLVTMGGEPSNNGRASGVYYLQTNSNYPFAQGL